MMAEGELSAAFITGPEAAHRFEVFCHPFTAGETVAQSRLGVLRVNGEPATAQVVERLGNGDYIVRIEIVREEHAKLELVA